MLDKIEDAIEDIKLGKLVIVVDDEDRENEGDFITSAKNVTPEDYQFYEPLWQRSYLHAYYRKKSRRT